MSVDPLGGAEVEPPSDVDELHHAQGDGLDSSQGAACGLQGADGIHFVLVTFLHWSLSILSVWSVLPHWATGCGDACAPCCLARLRAG